MGKIGNILNAARVGIARLAIPVGYGIGIPMNNGPFGAPMAYEAGRETRRDAGWRPQGLGPNAMAEGMGGVSGGVGLGGLEAVRNRARDLADNNEIVDSAAWTAVDAIVRTGLDDFEPNTGFADLDGQLRAVYEQVIRRVDPERSMTLAESQELTVRELKVAGEIGVLRVVAPEFKGFPTMPAIELVEAERIPLELSGTLLSGNVVRQGIEYETVKIGESEFSRIVAYHILRRNPRDGDPGGLMGLFAGAPLGMTLDSRDLVRVPAENFDLIFASRRVKQLRGVPPIVSGMTTLTQTRGFIESTMDLVRLISSMGLVMETSNAKLFERKAGGGPEPLAVDASGNPITTVKGMQLMFIKTGTKAPTPVEPKVPGPQFGEVMRWMLRLVSCAFRRRYDETSKDYSQTTFASGQMGALDQDRSDSRERQKLLEHHTLPLLRDAANWGVLTGRVRITAEHLQGTDEEPGLLANPERLYKVWVGLPGRGAINPKQDADANATNLASNVADEIDIISADGGNWKRRLENRNKFEAEDARLRAKFGLPPRPVSPLRQAPTTAPDNQNADPETGESPADKKQREQNADGSEDGGINDLLSVRARKNGAMSHAS